MRALSQILIVTTALFTALPAAAQDHQSKWGLIAGAGAFVTPKYSGDDSYRVMALPFLRGSYGDKFHISVPEGANYKFFEREGLTLKAQADLGFPRKEESDSPFLISGSPTTDLVGLGNIGTTIELGGGISYKSGPLKLSAGVRQGIGGHKSIVGDASMSLTKVIKTAGPPIAFIITPNIKMGEDTLTQAYYGITAEQSIASGLPEYKANGGIYSVGVNAMTFMPTSKDSAFVLFASVRELTGAGAVSPLVKQRGDTTQGSVGLFWVKAFGQDARNVKKLVSGR